MRTLSARHLATRGNGMLEVGLRRVMPIDGKLLNREDTPTTCTAKDRPRS